MARKKKIELLDVEIPQDCCNDELEVKTPEVTPTATPEIILDAISAKVLKLRGEGYNDNQIAAMLGIHSHKVKNVK